MKSQSSTVLVLGAGKMVGAILSGLKKSTDLSEWMIYSPSGVSAEKLARKVGARAVSDLSSARDPEWILIGCKPQQLSELKKTLQGRFQESLYLSILAALSEDDQLQILGIKKLIRIMPNLPVEYNEGISLLSSETAKDKLSSFETFFQKLGTALVVTEKELEELTLLTGSGPAFFYEFAEKLSESFHSLDSIRREKLVKQVLTGSAEVIKNQEKSLSELTGAVTSKGGVTIAVLEAWRSLGFVDFLQKGIEKGRRRSQELKTLLRK